MRRAIERSGNFSYTVFGFLKIKNILLYHMQKIKKKEIKSYVLRTRIKRLGRQFSWQSAH